MEINSKKWKRFIGRKKILQKEMVNYMINTDKTLKATYEWYQGIINYIKDKDFKKFKNIINHPNQNVSYKMKQAIKLYKESIEYIANSFIYDINNGVIEGTNNLIKCIKRIAFGYRKYDHFIARIFLIKNNIKGWLSSSSINNSFYQINDYQHYLTIIQYNLYFFYLTLLLINIFI